VTAYPRGTRLCGASSLTSTGAEGVLVWTGRTVPTGQAVPVIYAHGLLGFASTPAYRSSEAAGDDFAPIGGWGHPVLVPDLGGPATWGNDTALAAFDAAVTWAGTALGCRTDKVVVAGESMGGLLGLNWAWRNPDKVAALWLRVPCVALEVTHDTDGGFTGTIDAAYGGHAGYLAALDGHDPMRNTGLLRRFADRARIWHATDDEFFPPAEIRAFARATGIPATEIPGTHAAGYDTPPLEVAGWLARTIRRNS